MQNAQALGRSGERDVELGRAAWSAGEDPVRVDDKHGVELQALGLRRQHRTRHTRRSDHHAGALTAALVADEFLDRSG